MLKILPVPQVDAVLGGGDNPAVVELHHMKDKVVAESVSSVKGGKHILLRTTGDGTQQHDDM